MKADISYQNNKRKIKIKVIGRDLWNGDSTMAILLLAVLKKYRSCYKGKNPTKGYPAAFSKHFQAFLADDPKLFAEVDQEPDEIRKLREEKELNEWLSVLDKMINAFDHIAQDKNYPYENEMIKEINTALKKNKINRKNQHSQEADKIRHSILEKYKPLIDQEELKIQEGLDLFAKHFQSIWV